MPEVLVMDHKNNYKSINKTFQSLSTFKKFKGMEAYQKNFSKDHWCTIET